MMKQRKQDLEVINGFLIFRTNKHIFTVVRKDRTRKNKFVKFFLIFSIRYFGAFLKLCTARKRKSKGRPQDGATCSANFQTVDSCLRKIPPNPIRTHLLALH